MLQVRKLVLAIAAASALTSGAAQALGLGEVTLKSALNQPLVAEIELLEARDLTSTEVLPSLASPEAFNKAGVDRQYFLTDLKFTPVIKPNGKSVIRVTSSKAVREPYLNFLVELLWPSGRLLREYTLLLDPPLYTPQPVIASAPRLPIAAPAAAPVQVPVRREPVNAALSASRGTPSAPSAAPVAASTPAQAQQYKTTGSDTLWGVAQRVEGGTVQQAMLAIQDLNPDAFLDGNINRLKSGQVLRMPDAQQVRSRSHSQAVAQVSAQNRAWSERHAAPARQLDATPRSTAAATPAQANIQDNLRLVAADTGKSSSGSDQGAATEARALGDKLAVAQERLDITHRENAELQSRMGDLQDQLTKLQRLVQLKDDQLAKLQAELAQAEKAPAPMSPDVAFEAATAQDPVAPVAVAQPEVATAIESTAPAVDPSEAAAPLETVGATGPETAAADAAATPPDLNYVEEAEAASAAQTAASELAHATEPWAVSAPVDAIAQGEPAQVKPEPVPAVEAQTPSSFYDRLLKDQTMLALVGGGALVVLLLLLLVISRRNARREAQLQEALANEAEPQGSFDATADDSAFEALSDIVQPVEAERQTAAQSGDPLGEAEIFIAYGRFNQAAELLEGAVNDEPARTDLRLRLMEVYAELGDRDGFIRQQAELGEIGGAAADVDQIKAKYPAMVGLGVAMAGGTAAAIEDMDDFNFDDLQFEDSLSDTSPASPVTSAQLDEDSFDLDLDDLDDLELDLGAGKAPTAQDFASTEFNHTFGEAELPASETTDLMADFSLDMDAPESVASPVEDDFLLDLDLDLDVPSVASPVIEPLSEPNEALGELDLPDDFDLSLAEEGLASEAEDSADFLAELDDVSAELQQLADGAEAFGTPLASGAEFSASLEPEVPVDDDEFDFLSGTDETATKLDLARAYVDMGDTEGARDILDEVINEGSDVQQSEARELLASLV